MDVAVGGAVLQIVMATIIATIYVVASNMIPLLKRQWLLAGLAFGVGVFFVMEYVVVPLSAIGHSPKFTPLSFALNLIAMMVFGTIIAWFAREK
jgi:glycopeptide antibiotics resistance protein